VKDAGERWPAGWVRGVGWAKSIRPEAEKATEERSAKAATVGQAVAEYVAGGRHKMSGRTQARVYRRLQMHAAPLWDRAVESVTVKDAQAFIDTLAETEAPNSVKVVRTYLGAAFRDHYAVREIDQLDPVSRTIVRKTATLVRPVYLTRDEFSRLLGGFNREDDRLYMLLLAYSGLRDGEAAGLRVCDIDTRPGREAVAVWQTVRTDRTIGDTKNEGSARTVEIPAWLAEMLRDYMAGMQDDHVVFGRKAQGRAFQMRYERAVAAANLAKRPRIHDMRHTHASWLLQDGVELITVSKRLGHSSIKITSDTYSRWERSDRGRAAADGLAAPRPAALRVVKSA